MKYLLVVVGTGLLVCVALWWYARINDQEVHLTEPASPTSPAEGGSAVFTPPQKPLPVHATGGAAPVLADPILVTPCTLTPIQEQEVASQLDGLIQETFVELGQAVRAGQSLAQLNDQKLALQVQLLEIHAASRSAELIARAQYDEASAKVAYAIQANKSGLKSVPELEFKTYLYEKERHAQEIKKAQEEQATAQKELAKARWLLGLHHIRSGLSGEVVKVYKKPGETVKQAEALFHVVRTDQLRIEGFCKVQHAGQLQPGQRVLVEPELQGRQVTELIGHTAPVTDLAVSADGSVLASAGQDNNVLLWSWPGGARLGLLSHPGAVHAVDLRQAGEPGQAQAYQVVTGCEDGKVRVWKLVPGKKLAGPQYTLEGHDGPVRSVRFSPDGHSCVTGGEDRRIGFWDLKTGQRLYWVHNLGAWKSSAHQGAVTALHLTADNVLTSAGRDNVWKVWQLDHEGATLIHVHRGRSGDVNRLGVHAGGQQLLFDHGEELRLLDRDSGTVLGALHNGKQGNFKEFALFSPSGRLILSAAGNGRIQLWSVPASPEQQAFLRQARQAGFHRQTTLALLPPAHNPWQLATVLHLSGVASSGSAAENGLPQLWHPGGFEIHHYRLPGAAQPYCGVFAPGEKVFFTGGTDRVIRAWAIPAEREREPREAVLTFVGSQMEQGTDLVRIQAILGNQFEGPRRLLPGTAVTLKIYPADGSR